MADFTAGVKQVGESRFEAYDLENQLIGTFSTSIMAALAHDTVRYM